MEEGIVSEEALQRAERRREAKGKGESQEILGVTCKFGFGVQNEAGQRLTEFC